MTSLGSYFIVILSYRKKRTVSTLIFIKTIKIRILFFRMSSSKARNMGNLKQSTSNKNKQLSSKVISDPL